MKRLISWLLALVLVIGLLPMSVFAAETDVEIGGDDVDIETDFSALSPIDLTVDLLNQGDFSATVTVPAKTERFYQASNVAGMYMTIDDGEAVLCTGDNRTPYTWSIVNANDAETTYTIKVAFPVGHQMNPEVIEELAWSYFTVEQAAGDNDGYFYIYTAPADGTVTLYFTETPCDVYEAPTYDDEGNELTAAKWHADIAVTNNNTYENKNLQYDGVDNYGWELTVDVNAGDELIINTSYFADAEGNMYPAGTYTWCGNFQYPAGTEQNPIVIEWTWDENYTTATATVTAEEAAYYTGTAGMILTVNGEEVAMDEAGKFQLAAGEYNLVLSTPVGAQANPEVIENIDGYTDTNSLEADGSYYYIWTATEDGTVTLDVSDGANLTVDKLTYSADSEWPISTQYTLAEPEIDENWNYTGWTVAENLVIEVVAGEQLKIQVNGLTDWSTWTTPAIEYTLTGDFEAAVTGPIVDENLKFVQVGLSFQEYIGLQGIMMATVANKYDRVYVEAVQNDPVDGEVTEIIEALPYGGVAVVFDKQILSWSMPDVVSMTLYAELDGVTYVGQNLTTSVKEQAMSKLESYYASNDLKTCQVLVDMLNYGAEVQKAFDHNATNLPNADLGDYADLGTSTTPTFDATNSISGTATVNVLKDSVSMQSKVEVQLIFLGSAVNGKNYEIRSTVNGVTTTIPVSDFTVMDSFAVARVFIKAANMRATHTIALYDIDTDEPVSKIYDVSIEAYAQSQLGGTYNDVFIAMMKYGDSVAAL